MQLHSIFAVVFAVCGLSGALYVPEGTPDGVYVLTEDGGGDQVLEKIQDLLDLPLLGDDLDTRSADGLSHVVQRADVSVDCYRFTLVANDIQRAASNLGNTCGEIVVVH